MHIGVLMVDVMWPTAHVPAAMASFQSVRDTKAFLPCQLLCRKKTLLTDQSLKSFPYRFSLRL